MGQAQMQAVQEAAPTQMVMVQGKLQKHAFELRQIATLSYEAFLESVKEINETTQTFCDINGKRLVFGVKKGTDATILWKGTVRIRCHKVNCRTNTIESTRLLNLKTFVHLCNEIARQVSVTPLDGATPTTLTASIILTELENHGTPSSSNEQEECVICMDRKSEVILSCSHSYCEQCIDEWNVNHKTCPICRAAVEGTDDTWVLTEKPDQREMVDEATGYLMKLADQSGIPSKSPND